MTAETLRSRSFKLIAAFACVYVIWGSTYLAIRFAVETMPPLLMAGTRFLLAGGLLYGWILLRGEAARPRRGEWWGAAVLGTLFFLGGNGAVSWAETRVPSAFAALLVATVPFWIVILQWRRHGGTRPSGWVLAGVCAGFLGVALLVGTRGPGGRIDPAGAAVLVVGPLSWAYGTILSRRFPHPASHLQSGAMQMLAGGVALCVAGLSLGEGARAQLSTVSARSELAFLYLVFAGSIVAFSAYNWLLQASTPTRVGTYAFVNPIVAVVLGWALAGEAFGANAVVAGAFIVAGVVLIVFAKSREAAASTAVARD